MKNRSSALLSYGLPFLFRTKIARSHTFQGTLNRRPHHWVTSNQYYGSVIRSMSSMKRKATDAQPSSKAKRQKEPEADYCDVETRKNGDGKTIWPASSEAMEQARDFLREWYVLLGAHDAGWVTLITFPEAPLPSVRRSLSQTKTQTASMRVSSCIGRSAPWVCRLTSSTCISSVRTLQYMMR